MMTLEEEKQMEKLIAQHVQEKAKEIASKAGNKYVRWIFRAISTAALLISGYLMTSCTIHATPESFDFSVITATPVNTTK